MTLKRTIWRAGNGLQAAWLSRAGGDERRVPTRFSARLCGISGLCWLIATSVSPVAAQSPASSETARFQAFLATIRPSALKQGVSAALFDQTFAGMSADASLKAKPRQQAEFLKPIRAYVASAASPTRVAKGQALLQRYRAELTLIQARFGVPAEIILAIWGVETDFGSDFGKTDVLRSLASQAFYYPQDARWRDEVVAALLMIGQRHVAREKLIGSWAGAMGHPQFLPSAYLKYAVSFDGQGKPADIWTSVPDSLASIANFLRHSGWRAGEPWGTEVSLPQNARLPYRQTVEAWRAAGLTKHGGAALSGRGEAVLYYPVGAIGPTLLLQPNFFVLKAYNFSDAYALSVALLSERIAGRPGVTAAWPDEPKPLAASDIKALQQRLAGLGFYKGEADGRIGPVLREAVHAYQAKVGISPADGYPSRALWAGLR